MAINSQNRPKQNNNIINIWICLIRIDHHIDKKDNLRKEYIQWL